MFQNVYTYSWIESMVSRFGLSQIVVWFLVFKCKMEQLFSVVGRTLYENANCWDFELRFARFALQSSVLLFYIWSALSCCVEVVGIFFLDSVIGD